MKYNFTLAVCLFLTTLALGQKKEKIKGNKEVVDIHNILPDFNALEISDEFKVVLQRDEINKYHLETDQNLVDVIKFDVVEGKLKIYATHNIQARKALNLTIYYNTLTALTIMNTIEIKSDNRIESDSMVFIAMDNARFDLDFNSKDTTVNLNGNSKGELKIKGDKASVMLSDNSKIDGNFNVDSMDLEINDRSDVKLNGSIDDIILTASDDTDVKISNINASVVKANISDAAEAWVYAAKEFSLYAKGKSNLYLSGEPAITIKGFTDKAKLIKQ